MLTNDGIRLGLEIKSKVLMSQNTKLITIKHFHT